MIPELIVGLGLACAIGVPLALIGALVAELAEHGRRRKPAPAWRRWARPLADRLRSLAAAAWSRLATFEFAVQASADPGVTYPATWERIRAGMSRPPRYVDTSRTLAEMNGPIVTDAEVDEEFERRPLAAKPWALTDDDIREQWERARAELPLLLPLRPCCPTTEAEAHRTGCAGARRPVNGRYLGTQPRRTPYPSAADPVTPAQTDDDPPWDVETAQQDAVPPYGVDRCEADVDEARRLRGLMIP